MWILATAILTILINQKLSSFDKKRGYKIVPTPSYKIVRETPTPYAHLVTPTPTLTPTPTPPPGKEGIPHGCCSVEIDSIENDIICGYFTCNHPTINDGYHCAQLHVNVSKEIPEYAKIAVIKMIDRFPFMPFGDKLLYWTE